MASRQVSAACTPKHNCSPESQTRALVMPLLGSCHITTSSELGIPQNYWLSLQVQMSIWMKLKITKQLFLKSIFIVRIQPKQRCNYTALHFLFLCTTIPVLEGRGSSPFSPEPCLSLRILSEQCTAIRAGKTKAVLPVLILSLCSHMTKYLWHL